MSPENKLWPTNKQRNEGQMMSLNVIAVTPHQTSVLRVCGPRFSCRAAPD